MSHHPEAVSFVIPVHNGAEYLDAVLQSVLAQADGRPMEILVVEDGSQDRSAGILANYVSRGLARVVQGPRRGATAALNEGIRRAKHPIICQVDQDVILQTGWMACLTDALRDRSVGAAQGYYVTPRDGGIWARVMGLDLENRYRPLLNRTVNHVCTGNTAYRADVLRAVGLFDETLGYGYDNDMSYRLVEAGYRLVMRGEARSVHRWRDGWWGYLVQQYGFGYGRLDVVAKHRGDRVRGDDVSGFWMMLHAPLMGVAVAAGALAAILFAAGLDARTPLLVSAGIAGGLAAERLVAGIRAALTFRDPAALLFAPMHVARDLAWVAAIVVWSLKRLRGLRSRPADSMYPRPVARSLSGRRSS
jgi:glycosyltransferase involved in cell wall biosynthesis